VLDAGALGKLVDDRRQIINDPVPPSRGISALVRIE
jgi:hypothetical protein